MSTLRIVIAGGGTGGHVVPALAIARELRDATLDGAYPPWTSAQIHMVGTARGLEARMVPDAGFPITLIHVGQLKNVSLRTRARTLADLPLGVARCMRLLRTLRPHVVVGVGGYASGPAMGAAVLLRIPTLAYEPNAVPGLANRLVGRFVSAAAVSFAQTTRYFRNATVTGVPVRQAIFELPPRDPTLPPHLLITAGSQGAQVFNDSLPLILVRLLDAVPGLTVLHQAGPRHQESTYAAYLASGADTARWQVRPFVDDMPGQLALADLVLARSGSTVAELAAAGKPSLLVPFPQAADDHQRKNAEVFASAGAALLLLQHDADLERLLHTLVELLNDRERLREMGERARTLAHPAALERISGTIAALAKRPASAKRPVPAK